MPLLTVWCFKSVDVGDHINTTGQFTAHEIYVRKGDNCWYMLCYLLNKLINMDSIHKNQPEDNFRNLGGQEAIEKIKETVKKSAVCFFCTDIKQGQSFAARPMSVQEVDDNGNCWFLSADDSHKNADIENDSHVQLLFKGSDYADFLSLYGRATISKDKGLIKELWKPIVKAWFTEGENDPRITVIKVAPQEGYYWDNKNGNLVALVKTAAGAVLGKTFDDSIEGHISI